MIIHVPKLTLLLTILRTTRVGPLSILSKSLHEYHDFKLSIWCDSVKNTRISVAFFLFKKKIVIIWLNLVVNFAISQKNLFGSVKSFQTFSFWKLQQLSVQTCPNI